ncbi:nibrin [Drosophila tropicalis]|uniref:nibrin n=1 Tax=Drosophila tropicalis TaxID=46794 RepID=UPI0035AC24FC
MFVLVKAEEKFVLLPIKKFYTVGRLSTDLILKDDLSISRTHVRLHLPQTGTDQELRIEDLGSKYGTFLNADIAKNKKMEAKVLMPVKVGSSVRFGAMSSIWHVTQLNLVTATSSLTRPQIQELEQLLKPLGGSVVQNWTNECNYLTMNEASVTLKLLHALLDHTPIVTCSFWRDLLQAARCVHVTDGWPQPQDYQPTNIDVKWRPERTKLFEGKTFVFMNRKHFDMYGLVVQKAGGACKDLISGVRKTFLTKKDVIVIQYVPSTQSQATETINSIQEILEQAGLRIIQEYEIGMALINCSTKEFCNPAHSLVFDSMPPAESMTSSLAASSSIIVPSTEQAQGSKCNVNKGTVEVVISESDDEGDKPQLKSKRPKRITATSTQKAVRKRNPSQFVDSPDEDEPKKQTSQITRKRKISDNCASLVNSPDEDKSVSKPKKQKSNNIMFVDSSSDNDDTEDKKKISVPPHKKTQKTKAKEPALAENLEKKTRVSPAQPRRSPPSVKTTKQEPEKQPNLIAPQESNESHSDEENLFQFKTTKINNLPAVKEKPVEQPPPRISVRNFLEKSQNVQLVEASERHHQAQPASQSKSRKRLRLELLNESDSGNEDNLFDFGDSKKQKRNTMQSVSGDDSNDDGLFNFQTKTGADQSSHNKQGDQDSICTEPFVPNAKVEVKTSKYVVPQPQLKSRVVNVSGWLSCGGPHDKLKLETNQSLESKSLPADTLLKVKHEIGMGIKQEMVDDTTNAWVLSMKDSIQVQMCSLNISSRFHEAVDATANEVSTIDKYTGRKNFKKFVRKSNLHPQKRILEMKRLQLADGMVAPV